MSAVSKDTLKKEIAGNYATFIRYSYSRLFLLFFFSKNIAPASCPCSRSDDRLPRKFFHDFCTFARSCSRHTHTHTHTVLCGKWRRRRLRLGLVRSMARSQRCLISPKCRQRASRPLPVFFFVRRTVTGFQFRCSVGRFPFARPASVVTRSHGGRTVCAARSARWRCFGTRRSRV